MILRSLFAAAFALLVSVASAAGADPAVANVNAVQRPGTKLVDITYAVTADTPAVSISLRISSDGGTSLSVPATTLRRVGGVVTRFYSTENQPKRYFRVKRN